MYLAYFPAGSTSSRELSGVVVPQNDWVGWWIGAMGLAFLQEPRIPKVVFGSH